MSLSRNLSSFIFGTYVRWEERPLSPSQSPGMGISPGALIAANCEGVLDLVNSKRSLCSSGSSTLLRTSVGCFKLLGKLSYTPALSSCSDLDVGCEYL